MSRIADLRRAHDAEFICLRDLVVTLAAEGDDLADVAATLLLLIETAEGPPRCVKRVEPSGRHVEGDPQQLAYWLGVVAQFGGFVAVDIPYVPGRGDDDPERAERLAEAAYRCFGWRRSEMEAFLRGHGIELTATRGTEATPAPEVDLRTRIAQLERQLGAGGRGKHFSEQRAQILGAALRELAHDRESVTTSDGKVIAARLAEAVNDRRVAHGFAADGPPSLDTVRSTIEAALRRV